MKMRKITAAVLAASMLGSLPPIISAKGAEITVSSTEEFIEFTKNCTLDTWSQGKTVNLTCDIELGDTDFSPIPTFGGTFNGNGFTISGISFSKSGSYTGLFRHIQSGGKVRELNVRANLSPGGSKSFIGGIAGENSGVIEKCSFEGNIKGENDIGGIAGRNTDSGQILSCTTDGSITGENSTGGISGKNDGLISDCTNNAAVNTAYVEKKKDATEINTDVGSIVESYKSEKEENEEESVLGHTDTGGIVGRSSGIIKGCTNTAAVGYQHIGYNVGGIVGRQSGYILGCENHGLIQGRKDTGGIAGQAEPYILLYTSESTMKDIDTELKRLHTMVNSFITDAGSGKSGTEQYLTRISDNVKSARDNAKTLSGLAVDFTDDNLAEINAQAAILSNTIGKLEPAFDNLKSSCNNLTKSLNGISAALDSIELYAPDLKEESDGISDALGDIADAGESISNATARAKLAVNELKSFIEFDNSSKVELAAENLISAVNDILEARRTIQASLEAIRTILETKPDSFNSLGVNAQEILNSIKTILQNNLTIISSLKTIKEGLDIITSNAKFDPKELRRAARHMEQAAGYLSDAMYNLSEAVRGLDKAMGDTFSSLGSYADDISAQLNKACDDLSDSLGSAAGAVDDIKAAVDSIKQIISDLSKEDSAQFVKLGDDFRTAGEKLFDSFAGISDAISGLKDEVSDDMDNLSERASSLSNQFDHVLNLLIAGADELKNGTETPSEIFTDVSDEDIENTKQGKIDECRNFGEVKSDRNVGGIAGAMAIEYAKDPEDDLEKPNSLNFTYQTKAILQDCVNDGAVTVKKDCSGGIVGLAEIGTSYSCENYGSVSSTGGNYIGGIVGKSETTVRKCFSKSKAEGKRYVGGIAGKAEVLSGCCSISDVKGEESVGAVCGDSDKRDNIRSNLFTDNGIGGIDGISYSGIAEPVTYEKLAAMNGIPKRFISFTVTFKADGNIVETREIKYGEDTSKIIPPDIPAKDGHFGKWKHIESATVTENIEVECEYLPYITVLSSEERNQSGKLAAALAEGEFTDEAVLHISSGKEEPPSSVGDSAAVYDIALSGTDIKNGDPVKLRILNENKHKASAYLLKDGSWEPIEVSERGKYVILQTSGARSTICIDYSQKGLNPLIFIAAAFLLMLIALAVIIKRKRAKKQRKTPTENKQPQSEEVCV